MKTTTHLGVGLYTYPEAARIVGISARQLRRWVSDYYYTSRGHRYHHEPIIQRYFADEPTLTFRELVELLFVRMFRAEGVSMQVIRRAANRAAHIFDADYPFTLQRFSTDGRHIFATLLDESDADAHLVEDISRGQYAFDVIVRPFFRKLDYGLEPDDLKLWPKGRDGRVVIDPKRSFGKPIDAETGVPTDVLYAAVTAGDGQTIDEVANWYDVPVAAVVAAVAYEEAPNAT